MRLIDADALFNAFENAAWYNNADRDDVAEELLLDAPTVDAVPVVRCGECKNYDVEIAWCRIHSCFVDRNGQFCHPWESNEWKMFDGAYYCADGERRADNGT